MPWLSRLAQTGVWISHLAQAGFYRPEGIEGKLSSRQRVSLAKRSGKTTYKINDVCTREASLTGKPATRAPDCW
nr:hypothetical protein BaRGS_002599 [Batillaria attramentaria]